jgi:putative membrane protein
MLEFIVSALVTAVLLLLISKLPIGVEIESFGKALWSGIVFGLLNAFVRPALGFFASIFNFVTFGILESIVSLLLNMIIFALAAWIVRGFELKNGFVSAFLGALALTILNSIIAFAIA